MDLSSCNNNIYFSREIGEYVNTTIKQKSYIFADPFHFSMNSMISDTPECGDILAATFNLLQISEFASRPERVNDTGARPNTG